MSIYVKTKNGAAPVQTPKLRVMKLNTTSDTMERADNISKIIKSQTIKLKIYVQEQLRMIHNFHHVKITG